MENILSKKAYTISQAVEALGLGKTSLYNQIKIGKIRPRKFGNRTLIPVSEIDKWLNELPEMRADGGENE